MSLHTVIKKLLLNKQTARKKKIHISNLEKEVIETLRTFQRYQEAGGYTAYYQAVLDLEREGLLVRQKKKETNVRYPVLPMHWWLVENIIEDKWTQQQMLQVSDLLNLKKYRIHKELQTDEEWKRINIVYRFLKNQDNENYLITEQRSYELFGHEKYLSSTEGKAFLMRLELSLSDLKAFNVGEPFMFSTPLPKHYSELKNVLIVENQSIFHTLHQYYKQYQSFRGMEVDILIYGEGKKIESSGAFFYNLFNKQEYNVYYCGDIDAEGWGIYHRLKEKNYWNNLQLAIPIYEAMKDYSLGTVPYKNQTTNETYLERAQKELSIHNQELSTYITKLWKKAERLPQEAIMLPKLIKEKAMEETA